MGFLENQYRIAESKTYCNKIIDINKKGKKILGPLRRKTESLIRVIIIL